MLDISRNGVPSVSSTRTVTLDDINRYRLKDMALVGAARMGDLETGMPSTTPTTTTVTSDGEIVELRDVMLDMDSGLLYMSTANVFDPTLAQTPQISHPSPHSMDTTAPTPNTTTTSTTTHRGLIIDLNQWYEIYQQPGYPFRAVGLLQGPGTTSCTGALIGPSAVVTAAQCVYDRDQRRWQTGYVFTPSMYMNGTTRFANFGNYLTKTAWVQTGWINNQGNDMLFGLDLGVIVLLPGLSLPGGSNNTPSLAGNLAGWFGYTYIPDPSDPRYITKVFLESSGYPTESIGPTGRYFFFRVTCVVDDNNPNDGVIITHAPGMYAAAESSSGSSSSK